MQCLSQLVGINEYLKHHYYPESVTLSLWATLQLQDKRPSVVLKIIEKIYIYYILVKGINNKGAFHS